MKKNSNSLFTQIGQARLNQLTTVVKETLAVTDISKHRTFTSADLWNIQRQAKQKLQRRFAI